MAPSSSQKKKKAKKTTKVVVDKSDGSSDDNVFEEIQPIKKKSLVTRTPSKRPTSRSSNSSSQSASKLNGKSSEKSVVRRTPKERKAKMIYYKMSDHSDGIEENGNMGQIESSIEDVDTDKSSADKPDIVEQICVKKETPKKVRKTFISTEIYLNNDVVFKNEDITKKSPIPDENKNSKSKNDLTNWLSPRVLLNQLNTSTMASKYQRKRKADESLNGKLDTKKPKMMELNEEEVEDELEALLGTPSPLVREATPESDDSANKIIAVSSLGFRHILTMII